jgi:hypothetical protein
VLSRRREHVRNGLGWSRRGWSLLTLTVVMICGITMLASGVGSASPDGGQGGGREAVREAALIAAHKLTVTQESKDLQVARRRWLETPAAVSQRAVSLMAFHGLASPMARTLLVHDYGSFLAGVSASPSASVAAMGRVVRYESDYRALVRTSHGLQFVDSTVPLRVANGSNARRPVDLRLVAAKGAFVPLNPLKEVSIADSSGGGVAVGTSGLRCVAQTKEQCRRAT